MIIKKYIGKTEEEAIELAKADLGAGATIMNTKEMVPHGLFKFFRQPSFEVTAAIDELQQASAVSALDKTSSTESSETPDFSKLQQALNEVQFTPAPDSKAAQKEAERERLIKNSQILENEPDDDSNNSDNESNKEIEEKLNTL